MLTTWVIALLTFFLPLFFSPYTANIFSTPKDFLLVLAALILIGNLVYRLLKDGVFSFHRSPLSLPLVVFILAVVASLVANPEGRPEALAARGMSMLLLPFIALVAISTADLSKLSQAVRNAFLASTTLLSLHSLLSLSFLYRSAYLPEYMQNIAFTPTGSYLTTLVLIVVGLAFAATLIAKSSTAIKNIAAFLLILHTFALVAIVSLMVPGGSLTPSLLPYQASWSIALDALKSLRSLLFGIGLSNYSLLYTTVKPLSVNATTLWNVTPTSGASELLTLLPTAGVFATASFLLLITKGLIWARASAYSLPFILVTLAFLLLPISLPLYLLFFLALVLLAPRRGETTISPLAAKISAISLLCAAVFIVMSVARVYASEYLMKQAQNALVRNDSQSVYSLHLQAAQLSPKIANYHLSFAEVNFRLAISLSQKENLTDADRDTISRLIQQSINSSKAAITLRPNSAVSWIALAKIYGNLINVAEGSDSFAIEAYNRAISLDRANPLLRLEFGNLLSQLATKATSPNDKSTLRARARNEFQTAIQLKSDYANGYYNLAKLYEAESDYQSAVVAMQQVLKYLDQSSAEYAKATSELDILQSKLPKSSPTPSASPTPTSSTSELSEPSPLPSPLPGGPVEIVE